MTTPELPNTIYPVVTEAVENDLLLEIAREWSDAVYSEINDAFGGYIISPGVKLPPRQLYEKLMLRIVEAYPEDEAGRMGELAMLLDPDYVDLVKQGIAQPPLSMPWAVLIKLPRIFVWLQGEFRSAYMSAVEPLKA